MEKVRESIIAALQGGNRLLLRAPTGSGKSTRVPVFLLDPATAIEGEILVVQPRRMAARLLAGFVAGGLGERVGERVGYAVRFERKVGPQTRAVFLTDGLLARRLKEDPTLKGVGAVVFDEFHERRVDSDLSLGRVRELQKRRPDLRLVVMSATLDAGPIAEFLEPCQTLEVGGRTYPVELHYRAPGAPQRGGRVAGGRQPELWERIAQVAGDAAAMEDCGEILIFLPGAYEIRRCLEEIGRRSWASRFDLRALHGAMPAGEQDATLRPGARPRLICSTNVAETSLTIDGIRTVIDSGLARMGGFEARRGIDTLLIEKISQASAEQRAGRAGRTSAGRCFRLWSERDHAARPAFTPPEVYRMDLSGAVLDLKVGGWPEVRDFPWLDLPEREELQRCEELLHSLDAVDETGQVTETGVEMSRLGLPPRFARLLLAGAASGCVGEAAFVAAVVQGEELFLGKSKSREAFVERGDCSDFAAEWRALQAARAAGLRPERCTELGIRARAAREVGKVFEQMKRQCEARGLGWQEVDFEGRQEAFAWAMLAAFQDHLAVQTQQGSHACRLSGGRRGKLDRGSVARDADWLIAVELTEVEGREVRLMLRRATALEWRQLAGRVRSESRHAFSSEGRKVVRREVDLIGDLELREREGGEPDPGFAAQELARRVAAGELVLKNWNDGAEQFVERVNSLAQWMPELDLTPIGGEDRALILESVCRGATRYKEIKDRQVMPALREWLSAPQKQALDHYAPPRLKLENGREVKLRYQAGEAPVFGLQAQRLFGVRRTPSLCDGRVPVKVEILAPNQRPWQVTTDLEGFWESGFAQMKKELGGRYPKHDWDGPPH